MGPQSAGTISKHMMTQNGTPECKNHIEAYDNILKYITHRVQEQYQNIWRYIKKYADSTRSKHITTYQNIDEISKHSMTYQNKWWNINTYDDNRWNIKLKWQWAPGCKNHIKTYDDISKQRMTQIGTPECKNDIKTYGNTKWDLRVQISY